MGGCMLLCNTDLLLFCFFFASSCSVSGFGLFFFVLFLFILFFVLWVFFFFFFFALPRVEHWFSPHAKMGCCLGWCWIRVIDGRGEDVGWREMTRTKTAET